MFLHRVVSSSHQLVRDLFKLVEVGQIVSGVVTSQPRAQPSQTLDTVVEENEKAKVEDQKVEQEATYEDDVDPFKHASAPPASEVGEAASHVTLRADYELPQVGRPAYIRTLQASQAFLSQAFHGKPDI